MLHVSEGASLQAEALYHALSDLLLEVDDILHTEPTSNIARQLQQAGFKQDQGVYRIACKDLQVLQSLQKLKIPAQLLGIEFSRAHNESNPVYAGSPDNVAGITESVLISANTVKADPKHEWQKKLAPEIEASLAEHCNWLTRILECSDSASIPSEMAQQVETLDALQYQNVSTVAGLAEDARCYLTLLSDFIDQQTAFVKTHKLSTQKDFDMKESMLQQSVCRAQILKVKVIEQRLLSFTYTDQSLPALKAVSKHLRISEKEVEETHQQLAARVRQFEELGPDFASLAERYQQLLEDLRHAEFTLQEFNQEAAEVATDSP